MVTLNGQDNRMSRIYRMIAETINDCGSDPVNPVNPGILSVPFTYFFAVKPQ
jgi:hypothetical protein